MLQAITSPDNLVNTKDILEIQNLLNNETQHFLPQFLNARNTALGKLSNLIRDLNVGVIHRDIPELKYTPKEETSELLDAVLNQGYVSHDRNPTTKKLLDYIMNNEELFS